MRLFSKIWRKDFAREKDDNSSKINVVEVGWLLQTDHASFIWPEPRSVQRALAGAEHSKSVVYCPSVIDYESRLIEVGCPFDLRLGLRFDDMGEPSLVDLDGEKSSLVPRALNQLVILSARNQWRHPTRPLLQIRTPYIFLADETVFMNQMPPFLHYREPSWPGIVVGGRIPIDIWPRMLTWAFEWYNTDKELILKQNEPWFYCRFETVHPARHVRLVEAELTPELKKYLAGISGVVNYVNGTYSLFATAQKRRPERLLAKVERRHRSVRAD